MVQFVYSSILFGTIHPVVIYTFCVLYEIKHIVGTITVNRKYLVLNLKITDTKSKHFFPLWTPGQDSYHAPSFLGRYFIFTCYCLQHVSSSFIIYVLIIILKKISFLIFIYHCTFFQADLLQFFIFHTYTCCFIIYFNYM